MVPIAARLWVKSHTTRLRLLKSSERLELDVLDLDTALALLEPLVETQRLQRELQAARDLCLWLGYLPLGVFCKNPRKGGLVKKEVWYYIIEILHSKAFRLQSMSQKLYFLILTYIVSFFMSQKAILKCFKE